MTQDPSAPARTTRGLGAVLQVPGLPDVALPALLRYSATDPYAVRLVLLLPADDTADDAAGAPESVEWLFSRSLLTEGLLAPTGEGDVQVRVDGRSVVLELAGSAVVVLPLDGMVEFLTDSYAVVPTGSEPASAPDLDAAIARLLDPPTD